MATDKQVVETGVMGAPVGLISSWRLARMEEEHLRKAWSMAGE